MMTDVDAKTETPSCASNSDSVTPAASPRLLKGVSILGFNPESRAEKAGMEKGDVIVDYSGVADLTVQKLATQLRYNFLQNNGAGRRHEGVIR